MNPLDFPDSPAVMTSYLLTNGITYLWDGIKWTLKIESDDLLNYWSRNNAQNQIYPRNFEDELLFDSLGVDYLDNLPEMAIQYQVNIQITAGCDFRQEYTLGNPDLSPKIITGATFKAGLSKHAVSINAHESTRDEPVYKIIPFATSVVDGNGGVYSIGLTAEQTQKLEEGKYMYNVVMVDVNGTTTEVLTGLAFVEKGFASLLS